MVNGHVETICPDAAELADMREHVMPSSGYRTVVALDSPYLDAGGKRHRLTAGMLVSAQVKLGSRTVMEYLLSPVRKVAHEAGREMQTSGIFVCAESDSCIMQAGSSPDLMDTGFGLPQPDLIAHLIYCLRCRRSRMKRTG